MKKLMFTFAIIGYSLTASAACDEQFNTASAACDDYSTYVCGQCYSMQIPLTGYPSVDTANFQNSGGTMRRKPNTRELSLLIEAVCW